MSGQIDSVVVVNITATSAQPTVGNFGTPAFLQYHTHNTDLVRTYTDTAGMTTDGFTAGEPAMLWATAVLSQNPHPPSFKIIRGTTAVAQSQTFVVTDNATGHVVGLNLTGPDGVVHPLFHTNGSETTTQIATAIAALVNALTGVTATSSVATVTIATTAAGAIWTPSGVAGGNYSDNTTSSSPGTDINATILVDTDWYGITGAINSDADITAVAVSAAANKKTHYYTTSNTTAKNASAGIGNTLKTAGYTRSYGQFSYTPNQYGASALEALEFTKDPGTYTDAFKALNGVTIDALTPTERTNLTGNNLNYYVNIGGVNCTFDGRSASGQFMDLTRFLDALQNDIQIRVFTLIVNSDKVPYTAHGIAAIGAEVSASLQSFVTSGALSNDTGKAPQVSLPDIAAVSTADKLARTLRNVKFSCTYTDGIHSVNIAGVVNL